MIVSVLGFTLPVLACHVLVSRTIGERRRWLVAIPISAGFAIGLSSVVWWALMAAPFASTGYRLAVDLAVWTLAVIVAWRIKGERSGPAAPNDSRHVVRWLACGVLVVLALQACLHGARGRDEIEAVVVDAGWDVSSACRLDQE